MERSLKWFNFYEKYYLRYYGLFVHLIILMFSIVSIFIGSQLHGVVGIISFALFGATSHYTEIRSSKGFLFNILILTIRPLYMMFYVATLNYMEEVDAFEMTYKTFRLIERYKQVSLQMPSDLVIPEFSDHVIFPIFWLVIVYIVWTIPNIVYIYKRKYIFNN